MREELRFFPSPPRRHGRLLSDNHPSPLATLAQLRVEFSAGYRCDRRGGGTAPAADSTAATRALSAARYVSTSEATLCMPGRFAPVGLATRSRDCRSLKRKPHRDERDGNERRRQEEALDEAARTPILRPIQFQSNRRASDTEAAASNDARFGQIPISV
jgi:hypothetical protein